MHEKLFWMNQIRICCFCKLFWTNHGKLVVDLWLFRFFFDKAYQICWFCDCTDTIIAFTNKLIDEPILENMRNCPEKEWIHRPIGQLDRLCAVTDDDRVEMFWNARNRISSFGTARSWKYRKQNKFENKLKQWNLMLKIFLNYTLV